MNVAEFNKEVLRVARRYRGTSNQIVNYEDVAQDVWEHILKNNYLPEILEDDDKTRRGKINTWVRNVLSSIVHNDSYWSENSYYYSPKNIRHGLKNGFESVSVKYHYMNAFKMLEYSFPHHAQAIEKRYFQKVKLSVTERKHVQRGVDRITDYMNDLHESDVKDYEGPGVRKATSNSAGRVKSSGSWNTREYSEDTV